MEIAKLVQNHSHIMLDTAPIIYYIEEHVTYSNLIDSLITKIMTKNYFHLFSSTITLLEVLTHPKRNKRNDLVEKYRHFLTNSNDFTLYSIDSVIAEKAAEIRAKYNISSPDAIQIAVGVENNASLFITNDKKLKKIQEFDILVLEEYV